MIVKRGANSGRARKTVARFDEVRYRPSARPLGRSADRIHGREQAGALRRNVFRDQVLNAEIPGVAQIRTGDHRNIRTAHEIQQVRREQCPIPSVLVRGQYERQRRNSQSCERQHDRIVRVVTDIGVHCGIRHPSIAQLRQSGRHALL